MKTLAFQGSGQTVADVPEVNTVRILGHETGGTSVHLPSTVRSHDVVLLTDVFPTPYDVGVLNGNVGPDPAVVVGTGPVGLAAVVTAGRHDPGTRCHGPGHPAPTPRGPEDNEWNPARAGRH
ncbi:hypothetical protein [Streptomyces sp. NPDC002467]|uniref:hypothetical protein n=1 Tax=Streptomyces sp. NPDC002467 TaxID=3364647 RepID=UPI0036A8870A